MCARLLFLAVVSAALAACHSGSDSGSVESFPPIVGNTGLAARQVYGTGILRVVAASEADQERDLDGDGDRVDFVAQILDLLFKTPGAAARLGPASGHRRQRPPRRVRCERVGHGLRRERQRHP
ncbi:MAG: hypothetical protein HOP15_04060 [Planctomycetes bacterium]|nr:hypothetical protein [Planctomycetota bacterium]